MSAYKLASRYAQSILDLAIERKELELVFNDMKFCEQTLKASRELVVMFKNPIIPADKKKSIVAKVFGDKVSALTISFFNIMISKKREAYLDEIIFSFIHQYNKYKHITPVRVVTASKPTQQFLDAVSDKLKKEAGLEVLQMSVETDESLIGGFVVQYYDKMIDASIIKDIKHLRKELSDNKYINQVYSNN
jgi:F-type H+-transporting ATPase subunit delta